MNCRYCNNPLEVYYADMFDNRYGYPGTYTMWKCKNCDHLSLEANFTPEMIGELYSNYYPRKHLNLDDWKPYKEVSGFMAWFKGERSAAHHWVPKNVRILDIGCGFGETLGYHENRGCEVFGVEADDNIKRVADKYSFNAEVGLFDPEHYQPDYFDYVTMAQVIEHVTDPVVSMKGIAKILKPGGVAILTTPNAKGWGVKVFGKKWAHWHIPYHLHLFSKKSMKKYAAEAGLVLEKAITLTNSEWLHYQWLHIAVYPKRGEVSVFWTLNAERTTSQKIKMKILAGIHRLKVNYVITRFFDAFNAGDNSVYFLKKPL
ncbi:2-polyprenyl-3-methyl-5-hydroxy-6-metoxy-1,4-benzoquinol methylase [Chitinophaga niastensis]|uniref:2-polyprenyl-3-methyl-5-hydroxy-6-metoxy-1, 4-benzoquinol methylase n=1 Tax=Chitinophaga niastensis TaxID=536980 RepID=A0A2P8HFI4_CHINA|nr:class I SAM-dependent methyltransferase [Chitinophaga niastensis]PSL44951.1 2-polyprenyl-3-methyl-5-hydroxy-6-metoxy-1,4-benzoquinol methylase [Chitinophaga niastensis]